MDDDFVTARDYYTQALAAETGDKDNILRNLCILEYRSGNINKAKELFVQLKDNSPIRNLNKKMYNDLFQ